MEKKKLFYGWWVVIGCMILMASIGPISIPLTTMYLIPITEEFEISRSAFLIINTLMQALGILFAPILSKAMGKGSVKKFQIFGVIGFVLTYFMNSFAPNIWFLYITGMFQGLFFFMTGAIPANMLISKWFVTKRGLATSLGFAGFGIGGFVMSPILSFLLEDFGWRMTYRIVAMIVLAVALPAAIFLIKDTPQEKNLLPLGFRKGITQTSKTSVTDEDEVQLPVSAKQALKKNYFRLLLFGMFLSAFVGAGSSTHFAPALGEFHSPGHTASVLSLFSITGVIGKLLMGWLLDKVGITKSIIFGGTCFVFCMFFLIQSQTLAMAYLMAIAFGLGSGLGTVIPPVLFARVFKPSEFPAVFGYSSSAVQVGLATGALTVAFLYDIYSSYRLAWFIFLGLALLQLAALLFGWLGAKKQIDLEVSFARKNVLLTTENE
ncbi:MAG: MFS transporter [Streptococcaceae bacterium]|nr:MFS transporter [Streptococcaceae bacterium]